uniref:1-acylglycerol-3-phosphate O-acyltransferase n=1 Tax=Culicoides sonorensis TaxID=179676 RepID=A0A336LPN0_CULSO
MSGLLITTLATLIIGVCSKRARFYAKFMLLGLGVILVTVPFVPFMLLRGRDYRNVLVPSKCFIFLGKLLGITFEVRGLENIDKERGGVVVVNHQSALDIIICCHLALVIGKFTAVVKKEIFYVFPFGWLWGTIYLDRKNKKAGRNFISQEIEEIKNNQVKVLIYPEGTRNQGTELLPFKKGAFHIALDAQSDIYPVVVSRYHFLDSKSYRFGSGKSIIEILPSISTKGMTKNDIEYLIKVTRDLMQQKYKELSNESLRINKVKF